MINNRQCKYEEPSSWEVDEMIKDSDDEFDEEEEREEEREYINSVAEDKSPLYGNLQLRDKPEDVLRFFSYTSAMRISPKLCLPMAPYRTIRSL